MLPINIYALTRVADEESVKRLERQMSKRNNYLKVKKWEMESLRMFQERLSREMEEAYELCFFYSFVLPKLGKEFDLLRISEKYVVNIELKSGHISEEAVKKQLLKNRYYLLSLGREIYSYTYISEDDRLVRLTKTDKIAEGSWDQLAKNLRQQENVYEEHIEDLFKEEQFLISPLSDPEQFLRREYFLTSQQFDIKRRIRRNITGNPQCFQGFTGLPGTGKSILLYDLAVELSRKKKIVLLYFGKNLESMKLLDARMKRVDIRSYKKEDSIELKERYGALLVDEGHWMTKRQLEEIRRYAASEEIPVIVSYDWEDAIAPQERSTSCVSMLEQQPGYIRYQLTNRIRVNGELSSFVNRIMAQKRNKYKSVYPSVQLMYADTGEETKRLLQFFRNQGYQFIWDPVVQLEKTEQDTLGGAGTADIETARCMEYDAVVMLVNDAFYYDEQGNLRFDGGKAGSVRGEAANSPVRNLYHGLNRAKKRLGIIVQKNQEVFERFLFTLQNEKDETGRRTKDTQWG